MTTERTSTEESDPNDDGVLRDGAGEPRAAERSVDARTLKHIVFVDPTRRNVYFGFYRASMMTEPAWTLFDRAVAWATGLQSPAATKVFLATYNGTLNPKVSPERDGVAVHARLIARGYRAENITVRPQQAITDGKFAGYHVVILANSFPQPAHNVLKQGVPLVTMAAGQTDEMHIGTGAQTMHEYIDTAFVVDDTHYITRGFAAAPSELRLARGMWTDASTCTNGQLLVEAVKRRAT